MSKLICTLHDRVIAEHALNKERISFGRRGNNDIVIDNLSVSGVHAHIITIGNNSIVEDANSSNGTFVNLKPIKKYVLNDGDVIEIGRHQFKYVKDNAQVLPSQQTEMAGSTPLGKSPHTQPPSLKSLIQMSRPMKSEEEILSETLPVPKPAYIDAGATNKQASLKILNGSNSGKVLSLTKTLTTLGKPETQVVAITKRASGYFLSQIEGKEKLIVNGLAVNALSYALKNQDVLEISGIKMEFSN